MPRTLFATATLALLTTFTSASIVTAAPLPTLAGLVAHFQASAENVSVGMNGDVESWTATNNNTIVLNRTGTAASNSNIQYNPTGMNGSPTIEVNDFTGDNLVLQGSLNVGGTLTQATWFWLGYFSPGRDGSLNDGSGQYIYSYGVDGADGTQMDFQTDDGISEVYSGNITQSSFEGEYTVWRAVYGAGGGGDEHSAFANGNDLNWPSPNSAAYGVDGSHNLILFGYQNSAGASGGFNFVGNISELIVYNRVLSPEEVGQVEAYLASRIPEPSSFVLLALGVSGAIVMWRSR